MLNELWLVVSGLLILIGLVASQGLLLVVGALVIIIWLVTKVWDRHAFSKVSHSRSLSHHRAFIGDSLAYSVTLSNDKMLPLIWVDIQDSFPEGLELSGTDLRTGNMEGTRQHSITTSLLPYQQVTWEFKLRCDVRGYHRIGPVRLRTGDIFGFTASETEFTETEDLLVYPRVVDLGHLLLPEQYPFGSGRGRQLFHPDTTRFMGQREYLPGDPMKHIDWKATARVSQLQTKIFEPAVSLNLLVALNASTSEQRWERSNRRLFERAVTVAASVANHAAGRGYSFGLIGNAVGTYSSKWISVPVGAASSQLTLVLDALATAGPYAMASLGNVFQAERHSLPPGATVVVVAPVLTDTLRREVAEIKEAGYQVLILYAGDGNPEPEVSSVPVYPVGAALEAFETYEPVLEK